VEHGTFVKILRGAQMETVSSAVERRPRIHFPESVDVVEFTLQVADTGPAADELAAHVRTALSEEFAKSDPLLASLYELEIEEIEIWEGSRNSRNKGRLKRRRTRGWMGGLRRIGASALLVLTLASTDYSKIPQNFEAAQQKVEQIYHVVIKDVHIVPPNFRSP
jgi:hypothetical protein